MVSKVSVPAPCTTTESVAAAGGVVVSAGGRVAVQAHALTPVLVKYSVAGWLPPSESNRVVTFWKSEVVLGLAGSKGRNGPVGLASLSRLTEMSSWLDS